MATIAGSFWSWFTAIVAVATISTLACVGGGAKILAIVGGVFCFLSFLLMAIAAIVTGTQGECLYYDSITSCSYLYDSWSGDFYWYCYDDDGFNPCHGLAIVAGLGSLAWIAPGIIAIKLACQLGQQSDEDVPHVQAIAVDTEKGEASYEAGTPNKENDVMAEKTDENSRRIEEETNTPDAGPKIVKVKNMPPPEEEVYIERDA